VLETIADSRLPTPDSRPQKYRTYARGLMKAKAIGSNTESGYNILLFFGGSNRSYTNVGEAALEGLVRLRRLKE
jgi:hypothetical protein